MGSGASKYGSVEDALADGKTQEEIDEYLNNITDTIVKLPTIKTTTGEETNIENGEVLKKPSASIELAPFDISNRGRTMPMFYYYADTLNAKLLISSLQQTLLRYPVYCGRYDTTKMKINLNNEGVPFMITNSKGSIHEAIEHLLPSLGDSIDLSQTCLFQSDRTDALLHPVHKEKMDPDSGNPDAPLMAIRCSFFAEGGGTAIAISLQHGVGDAESHMAFMVSWSRVYRGLNLDDPVPFHDRTKFFTNSIDNLLDIANGNDDGGDNDNKEKKYEGLNIDRIKTVQPGEKSMPEFLPVMGQIMGKNVCVIPMHKTTLNDMKSIASEGLNGSDRYVSTDDVLSAKIWRAMCKVRCKQVGVNLNDADEQTTLNRAFNIRNRTNPPLPEGYTGNGVTNISLTMSVNELCITLPIQEIALRLRASILNHTHEKIVTLVKYHKKEQVNGAKTQTIFDAKALTFIISSWNFPKSSWELADFNSKPICYDHACIVPVVCVLTQRANSDGMNVWHSGTEEAVNEFVALMNENIEAKKKTEEEKTEE